jgi:hypothetical protein
MTIAFDELSIPGRHHVSYRIHDAMRGFPEREVEVLATPDEIQHFVREGYLVRKALLPEAELVRLRAAFDEVFERDQHLEHGSGTFAGTFARHMADKHPAFLELLAFAPVLSVARAILGPSLQSRGVTGRLCRAGQASEEVEWHFHQRVIPEPLPPLFMRPHTVDMLLYLDDARGKNGSPCVLPRSHDQLHTDCPGGCVDDLPGQVVIEAEAGTCVLAHGALWHRALPRGRGCDTRRMVIQSYGVCWMKSAIYGTKPDNGLTQSLGEHADDETRELLGLQGYM